MEINERAHYKRQEIEGGGGYVDVFSIVSTTDTKVVDYIISVSKIIENDSLTSQGLMSVEYKNSFANSCNCEVTGVRQAKYKNIAGVLFNIEIKKRTGYMTGYSFNILKGQSIYNINFITPKGMEEKFHNEYNYTLNSMHLFK